MTSSRRNTMHNQRGFTLSEILVTTAIFAIIMIAALAVYDQSNRTFKTSTEAADLQQSTRIGFDKLISDVRMAGFDYNRGGYPTNSWEATQPDEQIEYAGATAMAFRANFNYQSSSSTGNGLEPAITPRNTTGQNIFPYVSTSNDEIVIYALRSNDSTKNTGSVSFYVDDWSPRSAFPASINPGPAAGTTSKAEHQLKLSSATCTGCGIDVTNANPPYTLYRITAADVLAGLIGTPVAENIRSMNFTYFSDLAGKTLLTNPDGTAIATTRNADGSTIATASTGAIGGAGQYDPAAVGTTTNFNDRLKRSVIQSMRVDLVGMNATTDLQGYQNPTETINAIKGFRQYSLSSLVVPRNLGKSGFPEPVTTAPNTPVITGLCLGHCGSPVLYWQGPTAGAPVSSYQIQWDTTSSFASPNTFTVGDPSANSIALPDNGTDDVTSQWFFRLSALNDAGQSAPTLPYPNAITGVTIKNNTKPVGPSDLVATSAQANRITLTWTSSSTNAAALQTLSCQGTGTSTTGSSIPATELIRYQIWRGTTANFTTANGIKVLDYYDASQPASRVPGTAMTWIDNVANNPSATAAGCVPYFYRIRAADRCEKFPNNNTSGSRNDAESDFYPAIGSNAIAGQSTSAGAPNAPLTLVVDTVTSLCPDPSLPVNTCKISLQWSRVSTTTNATPIGVDSYRITRKVKHSNNVPSGTYALDTTFGTGGSLDVTGFSQMAGSTLAWSDTTGPATDTVAPYVGSAFSYEYTVAASNCSDVGADSPAAQYPPPCTIGATIVPNGASGGTGDPASPWVLSGGDTLLVTPGQPVATIDFQLALGGSPIGGPFTVASPGPYVYPYSDQTDGQVYSLTITLTTAGGCVETFVKYLLDFTPQGCALPSLATSPAFTVAVGASLSTVTMPINMAVGGPEPIKFHIVTPLFDGTAKINWGDPTGVDHPTLKIGSLTWFVPPSSNYADGIPAASQQVNPITRTIPAALIQVTNGATLRLTISWNYAKTEPALLASPLRKLCIAYQIASEPGTTKFCNVVGRSATTSNPTSCD